MMTVATQMTADELLQLPDDGWRYELVHGELRKMSPTGADHGDVAAQIIISLGAHVNQKKLGKVYTAEAGFRISRNPDTVRAPDVAFVRAERVVKTPKYFEGPPDVAFEVVSPSDSYSDIEEKTLDWLRAGVRAVVIVDPRTKSVRLHRDARAVNVTDVLEIDDVIPGWRMALSEIFD
ncbi:MAG TPA: Uma2 family endonuclease [Thermoanaerobaculia bacterium]|nr:Uma2 family endonuclease [Thermoanaerobaculia bacterium]